jgi:hypothetical protein
MTINKATMALAELAEKGVDADLLREMIRHVAQLNARRECGCRR